MRLEALARGYQLAEAPVALPDGGVAFSDALAGGVFRWDPLSGAVGVLVERRRGIGGMALHARGGVVVSGRDVSHIGEDGTTRTLLEAGDAAGFNDLTVDPAGRVVVGTLRFRPFAGEEPVPGEFARIDGDDGTTTVLAPVDWANGCGFSPDGSTFYGCDFQTGVVFAVDCLDDGTYGAAAPLVRSPSGDADGLAVDDSGALWVALGGGSAVGRFRPDGTLDATVEVDAGFVASVCFGAPGELFVTTAGTAADPHGGALLRAEVAATGVPVPAATS